MDRFRRLFWIALLAGLLAGLSASVVHLLKLGPLIVVAEVLEARQEPTAANHTAHDDHAHEASAAQPDATSRAALTIGFNCLTGFGFALLLCALFNGKQSLNARRGAAWGAAGFIAFFVAPALGLPPSLPGSELAEIGARQTWWLGTAAASAVGLMLLSGPHVAWRLTLGSLLLALPHAIGAPPSPAGANQPPAELAHAFVVWTAIASALFWLALGTASGWLVEHYLEHKPI